MKKTPRSESDVRYEASVPLCSIAGRADGAQRHAERVGDEVRQRRLADAGRAREEHVVERLAALLRRRDEDLEVLDDLGLADVLVEAARAQRRVVLERRRVHQARARRRRRLRLGGALFVLLAHAATLLCEQAQRRFYEVGDAGARVRLGGVGGGALRLGRLVAEVDERRADRVRAGDAACGAGALPAPNLSRSSSTRRSAVFLPMPGILVRRAWSPSRTARASSPGVERRQD